MQTPSPRAANSAPDTITRAKSERPDGGNITARLKSDDQKYAAEASSARRFDIKFRANFAADSIQVTCKIGTGRYGFGIILGVILPLNAAILFRSPPPIRSTILGRMRSCKPQP
jgi:hypothetical protein